MTLRLPALAFLILAALALAVAHGTVGVGVLFADLLAALDGAA